MKEYLIAMSLVNVLVAAVLGGGLFVALGMGGNSGAASNIAFLSVTVISVFSIAMPWLLFRLGSRRGEGIARTLFRRTAVCLAALPSLAALILLVWNLILNQSFTETPIVKPPSDILP